MFQGNLALCPPCISQDASINLLLTTVFVIGFFSSHPQLSLIKWALMVPSEPPEILLAYWTLKIHKDTWVYWAFCPTCYHVDSWLCLLCIGRGETLAIVSLAFFTQAITPDSLLHSDEPVAALRMNHAHDWHFPWPLFLFLSICLPLKASLALSPTPNLSHAGS